VIRQNFHDTGSVVVYSYSDVVKSNNLWNSFAGRGMSRFFSNQIPVIVEKSFNGPGPVFRDPYQTEWPKTPQTKGNPFFALFFSATGTLFALCIVNGQKKIMITRYQGGMP
jgi:hypothetical protein